MFQTGAADGHHGPFRRRKNYIVEHPRRLLVSASDVYSNYELANITQIKVNKSK